MCWWETRGGWFYCFIYGFYYCCAAMEFLLRFKVGRRISPCVFSICAGFLLLVTIGDGLLSDLDWLAWPPDISRDLFDWMIYYSLLTYIMTSFVELALEATTSALCLWCCPPTRVIFWAWDMDALAPFAAIPFPISLLLVAEFCGTHIYEKC